ncbi:hypothetical protein AB6A40_006515 [Gnathostoma spinigerum]|uniref:Uncharacterized protein n=1 Tax=Gnathostoma spinigerum TaxID=75299 RepID=A0ABD6EJ79_9BILA
MAKGLIKHRRSLKRAREIYRQMRLRKAANNGEGNVRETECQENCLDSSTNTEGSSVDVATMTENLTTDASTMTEKRGVLVEQQPACKSIAHMESQTSSFSGTEGRNQRSSFSHCLAKSECSIRDY